MRIRYVPADPAGNLTALTLTQVRPEERAAVAAQMMARCPERFEQVGFIGEHAAKAGPTAMPSGPFLLSPPPSRLRALSLSSPPPFRPPASYDHPLHAQEHPFSFAFCVFSCNVH